MNFTNRNSIFWRTLRLQLESTNQSIDEYPTFIHVRSVFNDEWYNFIIPIQEEQYFEWDKAEEIREAEKTSGKTLSYCIHNELVETFKPKLSERKLDEVGTEVYMHRRTQQEDIEKDRSFEMVDDNLLNQLVEMGNICFPDWENNEEFTRYFHELINKDTKNSYQEFLEKYGDHYVAYGCLVISQEEKMAYLHNTGTLPQYRRNGFFSSLIKFKSNLALNMGIPDLVAIVEEDEASYHALLNLEFEVAELFYLYTVD